MNQTKEKEKPMDIMSLPSEGPYVGISRDQIVKKGKNRYRLLLYGAYNAFGLIGSEYNGICVLNEDDKNVVADNILQVDSGYFGPAKIQLDLFDKLVKMPNKQFRELINAADNLRYTI
jgi:hypothetical protein